MKKKVQDAINKQINIEMQSAYTYLGMSTKMELLSFPGMASWLRLQWEEELVHAMKFIDFMVQRDAPVRLAALNQPKVTFTTPLKAFESVLKHEQFVTKSIHALYDLSVKENDFPLQSLLKWFIDEQVEEEDNARQAIDSLTLAGDSGTGLLIVDRELGKRVAAEAEAPPA